MRVGVGRPPGRMETADFVLRDFSAPEKKELPFLIDSAADAVEVLVRDGLARRPAKVPPGQGDVALSDVTQANLTRSQNAPTAAGPAPRQAPGD